ncbi:flagellar motor switch protein FliG [bacterium (Candidatus Blackallbacteria) CG17_big_fil_post_rev_8_21_14_2_50_48_46]|uniref:Flagellar motor switch protein FliG n=1 Tax=bacterium (Candidatus Blackallbacteria) CG17_big_fil_post_rev_8_21_14_2_50_48_46 TaxID=2014261 RepID=A0A2M7G9D1_9BACT|nr:MAG: flagellar motor switch protein FliG [bacterium (Candidatus Blackallbacteria) CG18_big_fil_WC_8_21_14_2_50_49_26]PIW18697.1 MAG: flagellar motor switch protein FliG [bacterium (Candidatus Blackallbacteria) CG17_big_fil_post_rev_8_21_14_2_50_48_46]PIW46317.1 MAG: flagellar motor switch protein FliG [bacterium (Candidatus Blackallbacteria) CG13_big_fil_rev_8_21_14_2_50_49_14]
MSTYRELLESAGNSDPSLMGRKKVALILIALGPELSSMILRHFDETEVEDLAMEISTMRQTEHEVVNRVLEEFYELARSSEMMAIGGQDYAETLLRNAFGDARANRVLGKIDVLQEKDSLPFETFRKADPAQVAHLIQNEHPQTISLILAYLKPEQAAVVLSNLSDDLQIEVSTRMATMERAGLEVVKDIEAILQSKFSSVLKHDRGTHVGGVKSLAEVLNRVDRSTERNIIENLERFDPELAESVKKLMFVFDDLIILDDRGIQRLLRELDSKDLALALKGANEDVQSKIFRNMSERASTMLQDDMESMGPVRLKDVEETQQKIVNIIRRLEEAGEIVISHGGEDIVI